MIYTVTLNPALDYVMKTGKLRFDDINRSKEETLYRGNADVACLYDVLNTAVLRLVEMTIKNAKKAGIEVSMCGEAAANESLIPRLVEWGLDGFSVTPAAILRTRKSVCECE